MKIDRSQFLMLVGAIAATTAAACTVTQSTSGAGGSSTSGASSSSTTSSSSSTTSSTSSSSGAGGYGTGGAGTGGVGTGGAGTGGAGGGACLGDVGNVPACAGNTCEGGDLCPALAPNMKQGVLAAAVVCLDALDTNTCLQTDQLACIGNAMSQACSDPASATNCATLATTVCNGVPIPNCEAYFDGLTPAGAAAVQSCVSQTVPVDCTENGLGVCEATVLN